MAQRSYPLAGLPALHVRGLDLPGIYAAQQGIRTGQLRNRLHEAQLGEIERKAALEEQMPAYRERAFAGDEGAAAMLARIDPRALKAVTDARAGWDAAKIERSKRSIRAAMTILGPILQMPQEQRGLAWTEGLTRAERQGINLEDLPGVTPEDVAPQFIPGMAERLGLKLGAAWEGYEEGPRKSRELKTGDRIVTQEYDEAAGRWEDIAKAPRFETGEGGLTATQRRENAEIDQARKVLNDMNMTRDELLRRTQRQTDTGRDNPDFDPFLSSTVRKATQRKTGKDPDFARTNDRYFGKSAPPVPAPGADVLSGEGGGQPESKRRAAPSGLSADLKARADRGPPFTEEGLRELRRTDPEAFEALFEYLSAKEGR